LRVFSKITSFPLVDLKFSDLDHFCPCVLYINVSIITHLCNRFFAYTTTVSLYFLPPRISEAEQHFWVDLLSMLLPIVGVYSSHISSFMVSWTSRITSPSAIDIREITTKIYILWRFLQRSDQIKTCNVTFDITRNNWKYFLMSSISRSYHLFQGRLTVYWWVRYNNLNLFLCYMTWMRKWKDLKMCMFSDLSPLILVIFKDTADGIYTLNNAVVNSQFYFK